MRQQLLNTLVACVAGLALSTQAQTSPGASPGSTTYPSRGTTGSAATDPSSPATPGASYGTPAGSQSGWRGGRFSATGRLSHEPMRGSQLTGAPVNGTSGTAVGTISDTVINPASGRLEFAVISLSGNGAASSTSTSTSTGTPGSTAINSVSSLGSGKQVAVPWMLLRPSMGGATTSASGLTGTANPSAQQPSFVFNGDTSKLQSAPSFDATTDLSQPSWRQSVFSFFGMTGESPATGAGETPGGTSSSTGHSTSPDSSNPGSTASPHPGLTPNR